MEENKNYELLYIVHPDLESSIDKITEHIRSYVEKQGGKINYEETWGKRKLAYEIKKNDVGIYILWFFSARKKSLAKIEKDLRLTEEIIRYIIVSSSEIKKETRTKKEKIEAKKMTTETKENEKARLKKIDEKLGELLGKEDNKKKPAKKEA